MSADPSWVLLAHKRKEMGYVKPHVYNTVAGPVASKLFSDDLKRFERQTHNEMASLRAELLLNDPCYAVGIQHTHEQCKLKNLADDQRMVRVNNSEALMPKWQNSNSAFSGAYDPLQKRPTTAPEKKQWTFCKVCETPEEHWRKIRAKGGNRPRVEKRDGNGHFAGLDFAEWCRRHPKRSPEKEKCWPDPEDEDEDMLKKNETHKPNSATESLKIEVTTESSVNADTGGQILIKLFGSNACFSAPLTKQSNSAKFHLYSNTTESFTLRTPILGTIQSIRLMVRGEPGKDDWLVGRIRITNLATKAVTVFKANSWIRIKPEKGVGERRFEATRSFDAPRNVEETEYLVKVKTGTSKYASTSSGIYLTIFGRGAITPRMPLRPANLDRKSKSGGGCFERGSVDQFRLRSIDVGNEIKKIRIESDGTGQKSDWFCEEVVVVRANEPQRVFEFPCSQWLSTSEGDRLLFKDILPVAKMTRKNNSTHKNDALAKYEIKITTGDVRFTGSSTRVFIQLFGVEGQTPKIWLEGSSNNFQREGEDFFNIAAAQIGEIKRIRIGHDNQSPGAGWFVRKVWVKRIYSRRDQSEYLNELRMVEHDLIRRSLQQMSINSRLARVRQLKKLVPAFDLFEFECNDWLGTDEGVGRTDAMLDVKNNKLHFMRNPEANESGSDDNDEALDIEVGQFDTARGGGSVSDAEPDTHR